MVQEFIYKLIECMKNKIVVYYIDQLKIEIVHEITEILKDKN